MCRLGQPLDFRHGKSAAQYHGRNVRYLAWERLIPQSLALRLKKAVGFRNIAVHNYEAIQWDIVHAIAWQYLDDFKAFAAHIVDATMES